jgi:glycerol-3-phosphate acyltransferase PlsY
VSTLLAIALAYLLGCIPSGVLVARARGGADLRTVGSGRTGATNALRALGKGPAAIVFLADFAKGALAVLVARAIAGGEPWPQVLAGLAAVVGHTYSLFLGFKGGRGVATGLGSLFAIAPLAGLVAVLAGAVAIALTRFVSLGSMLGASVGGLLLAGASLAGLQPRPYAAFGFAAAALIVVAHRDNIQRLRRGEERRLGQRI